MNIKRRKQARRDRRAKKRANLELIRSIMEEPDPKTFSSFSEQFLNRMYAKDADRFMRIALERSPIMDRFK